MALLQRVHCQRDEGLRVVQEQGVEDDEEESPPYKVKRCRGPTDVRPRGTMQQAPLCSGAGQGGRGGVGNQSGASSSRPAPPRPEVPAHSPGTQHTPHLSCRPCGSRSTTATAVSKKRSEITSRFAHAVQGRAGQPYEWARRSGHTHTGSSSSISSSSRARGAPRRLISRTRKALLRCMSQARRPPSGFRSKSSSSSS
ncbi:hypothetical protein L1887_52085 [Cichorium endivia]|nr:hypothetical protein L1887_52085 [Cichorium endivia]